MHHITLFSMNFDFLKGNKIQFMCFRVKMSKTIQYKRTIKTETIKNNLNLDQTDIKMI